MKDYGVAFTEAGVDRRRAELIVLFLANYRHAATMAKLTASPADARWLGRWNGDRFASASTLGDMSWLR